MNEFMGPRIQDKVRCRGLFPDLVWGSHVSVSRSTLRGLKKINSISLIFFGHSLGLDIFLYPRVAGMN